MQALIRNAVLSSVDASVHLPTHFSFARVSMFYRAAPIRSRSTISITAAQAPSVKIKKFQDEATAPELSGLKSLHHHAKLLKGQNPSSSNIYNDGLFSNSSQQVFRNLTVAEYCQLALKHEPDTSLVSSGALAARSYGKTGRSPKDKRVVQEAESVNDIWWGGGSPNYPTSETDFLANRATAMNYIKSGKMVFIVDAFANWDKEARMKIRVVCTRPYHALFMHNMLIRPTPEELETFGEPDFTIYNAGEVPADQSIPSNTSDTSVSISLKRGEMIILGTQYAGEMKKGVFTLMNYWMPKQGILSLHSGCNVGPQGDVSLFFGLSGTGKTTLSADPHRPLIGDDEHCWGEDGVFNIEGGCYAKCINLQEEKEPEIFQAIRFGTVLENIEYDPQTLQIKYESTLYTENTRASYPIDFISNAKIPCIGPQPKNIMLLCCDAFGVLPPVSKLTLEQAMYWFVSGYTAKIAGTEHGVTEPEATFSACFGAAFLAWHPMKYAAMLSEKMQKHGTTAWLINTGWTGGQYGVGNRISLIHTRAIVDAIHSGELLQAECERTLVFGLDVPLQCSGVPSSVLRPEMSWKNREEFDAKLHNLGTMFHKNFDKFMDGSKYVGEEAVQRMIKGGPQLRS
ncbi:hypothetical protein CEUSTIGMA_g7360.t1 [Chlamydomonas eustigma]|uniref:phosphoenolpyruvate carboxykinase (ATP) n=1 Tax=Chlamydomonas eustigma TaxID=1157962 RepID=A0A250XAX8_9CHLO|nr:hypothetical protein CEUSTIGMA_g7360.t1 [Chlamydomonas eustigma]|eukprot:GAX79920.1 hypothetical protein CEUSTIGMA_g7360.t1 [Chlamydomonas eustigma]